MGIILSQEDIDYGCEMGIIKKEGAKKNELFERKADMEFSERIFKHYYDHNKLLVVLHNKIKKSMQNDLVELKKSLANGLEEEDDD